MLGQWYYSDGPDEVMIKLIESRVPDKRYMTGFRRMFAFSIWQDGEFKMEKVYTFKQITSWLEFSEFRYISEDEAKLWMI
jgi:hypothetical protein